MEEVIGTKDAAKILNVSPVTAWRLAERGSLPFIARFGKQYMFNAEAVRVYAEMRRRKAEKEVAA